MLYLPSYVPIKFARHLSYFNVSLSTCNTRKVILNHTYITIQENVAIVEFGSNTRVVKSLTTDYTALKRCVGKRSKISKCLKHDKTLCDHDTSILISENLRAGGGTPMTEGLKLAMKEILEHGKY